MHISVLDGRSQATQIGLHIFKKAEIIFRVFQSSWPDDLAKCFMKFKFCIFADDTNLLYANTVKLRK